jgi:hypothetical protein
MLEPHTQVFFLRLLDVLRWSGCELITSWWAKENMACVLPRPGSAFGAMRAVIIFSYMVIYVKYWNWYFVHEIGFLVLL